MQGASPVDADCEQIVRRIRALQLHAAVQMVGDAIATDGLTATWEVLLPVPASHGHSLKLILWLRRLQLEEQNPC